MLPAHPGIHATGYSHVYTHATMPMVLVRIWSFKRLNPFKEDAKSIAGLMANVVTLNKVPLQVRSIIQGRYIIYHPWEGELDCEEGQEPMYGEWGGPNGEGDVGTAGSAMSPNSTGAEVPQTQTGNTAQDLADWLVDDLPELDIVANGGNNGSTNTGGLGTEIQPGQQSSACACRETHTSSGVPFAALALVGLGLIGFLRRVSAKALGHRLMQGGLFIYPALFILSACPRLIVPQAKAPVDQGPFGPSLTHIISEPGDLSLQTAQPCEECHQTQI